MRGVLNEIISNHEYPLEHGKLSKKPWAWVREKLGTRGSSGTIPPIKTIIICNEFAIENKPPKCL